jgi:hypothetical protein
MKRKTARRAKKKPYEPPKLMEYGTLSQLTLAKGGRNADGGGRPRSRLRRRGA